MATSASAVISSKIVLSLDAGTTFPVKSGSASWAPSNLTLANGTANGEINLAYASRLSVPNGAPVSIDLSGSLANLIGGTGVFVEVAVVGFYNRSTNTVTLSGNFFGAMLGTNGATITLQGGGRFQQDFPVAGIAVTNATADTITFTSAAGTNDVDVAIGGRDA